MRYTTLFPSVLALSSSISAWSLTFYDSDACAGGRTFHYGGTPVGRNHIGKCFTMPSIDASFSTYDAKSVQINNGGCSFNIFTDLTSSSSLGACTSSGKGQNYFPVRTEGICVQ
ncbi:uncharacterized protein CTRU02_214029 [Colletotrichum truncatum]|uniref:Uncharacterized protein n=1 Tax=Colletotrichum truncatum TaxID=5467 RepID=A0ACC3YHC1_COLTU|nr:uncharacterized protein CTRU02_06343 [Colletotrichum truncatum]KAF6792847.1 hypothetical protein CTRU02_06343 [Colletotrichum truncatum]